MKSVKVECTGSFFATLEDFDEFQGELKTLSEEDYERLRSVLLAYGFSFPFALWRSTDDLRWKTIDGHQRKRALLRMRDEGVAIPEVYPAIEVRANSTAIAKKKLLAAVAQYGRVNNRGLYDFMTANEIPLTFVEEKYRIPDISMPAFKAEFFGDDGGEQEPEDQGPGDPKTKTCPACGHEF